MLTNFFQQIAAMNLTGNIRLNIQPQDDATMTVSLLLVNDSLKDKSANKIPPLILKGSIEELDQKFFDTIKVPVQKTNQLLCNMKEHEAALKNIQNNNNKTSSAPVGSKDAKRKKFDEQMKKVSDLERLNKIGEAIGQMPDTKTYPEFETEIKNKMQQLRSKHGTLSLFGDTPTETVVEPEEDTTVTDPDEDIDPDEDTDPDEVDEPGEEDDLDPNR
ncbi:MAG: PRTRC system protein E [Bacteroidota bacterium]